MKLRLLKPYGMLAKGDVINPEKPVADLLIARKVAKKIVKRTRKASA